MASSNQRNLIKELSAQPRGRPLDFRTLERLGISSALASYYVRVGWLTRLGRGTFAFPGDTLSLHQTIRFLSRTFDGIHVGGRTALAWRGFRHNQPAREKIVIWGKRRAALPDWFNERFACEYVSHELFSDTIEEGYAVQPLANVPESASVSAPERALLEMLSAVGVGQEVDEARQIMAGLQSLRLDVLGHLLEHCCRVKVVRLCVQWSEELRLPWAADASELPAAKGRGRWVKKLSDGSTLILKP